MTPIILTFLHSKHFKCQEKKCHKVINDIKDDLGESGELRISMSSKLAVRASALV